MTDIYPCPYCEEYDITPGEGAETLIGDVLDFLKNYIIMPSSIVEEAASHGVSIEHFILEGMAKKQEMGAKDEIPRTHRS